MSKAPRGCSILDLHSITSKYIELSPDLYAQEHYQHMIDQLECHWGFADNAWMWLRDRLVQDRTPMKNVDGTVVRPVFEVLGEFCFLDQFDNT